MHQKSRISDGGRLSCRSSCSSLDLMSERSASGEHPNNFNDHCWGTFHASAESIVNNSKASENVKNELEIVNNREGQKMEVHLDRVNCKESLKMENHFVDEVNEIN